MKSRKPLSLLARLRGVRGLIRFEQGQVTEVRGQVASSFLGACGDVARLHRIAAGRVELVGRGKRQTLRFSRNLPEGARQAIANCWTPPPSGGGGGARASG